MAHPPKFLEVLEELSHDDIFMADIMSENDVMLEILINKGLADWTVHNNVTITDAGRNWLKYHRDK